MIKISQLRILLHASPNSCMTSYSRATLFFNFYRDCLNNRPGLTEGRPQCDNTLSCTGITSVRPQHTLTHLPVIQRNRDYICFFLQQKKTLTAGVWLRWPQRPAADRMSAHTHAHTPAHHKCAAGISANCCQDNVLHKWAAPANTRHVLRTHWSKHTSQQLVCVKSDGN